MPLPTIFDLCRPRQEVLAGELPDAIFAADLWDVIKGRAHPDYLEPDRFFSGTHPTENLKILVKDVAERLAGMEGGNPVFYLETGFGGGKTHSLIAAVHVAKHGERVADMASSFGIRRFPDPANTRVAAFVGENSDPLSGNKQTIDGQSVTTYTPWGQIALMAGGMAGYDIIKENDIQGVAPSSDALEKALGDGAALILIDELILYMARSMALTEDHPRAKINSQWPTFLQTLFSVAEHRPKTAVVLTLPSEQDANRRLTGAFKQHMAAVHETVDEAKKTTDREARNLSPTQTTERAAVLTRRLFDAVDASKASDIADAYIRYLNEQKKDGVPIENRAFDADYAEQIRIGYPFHPELIRLFAERLADIPEFQATRGALRLVARTIRAVWQNKEQHGDALLLQPHHIDLSKSDLRDEMLSRLGRMAFERGLDADVIRPGGNTHANDVESGWPWPAASEAALVTFLHSLPESSRGVTPSEVALALGRPGIDLAYIARGLEETERRAWYMRQEGEHYRFRTRASINKRFQERLMKVEPGEIRDVLDAWITEIYSGFDSFQIIPFPEDQTAIADNADKLRLVIVHYNKECGTIGGGDRLNFTKKLFTTAGVNQNARKYRNNLIFLLAETTRINGLKDAVQSLIAWERVQKDIEQEQQNLAQSASQDYRSLKQSAKRQEKGVPAEFMALESDLADVMEKLGTQELHVRTKLLEAFRVLAFPTADSTEQFDLFSSSGGGPLLECYRVDFGETPESGGRRNRRVRQEAAEAPILQCLRKNNKLVPEPTSDNPVTLAPEIVKRPPLWKDGEKKLSTEDVWDRLRREPGLPFLLKKTDLLPTFRAGIVKSPDALWIYYIRPEKKVFTRDNAGGLSAVIAGDHFIYDTKKARDDRIWPVSAVSPADIEKYAWPRDDTVLAEKTTTAQIMEEIKTAPHFPVSPSKPVLWRSFQEGARESRWVLYLSNANLAIGFKEMNEWPGTPRIDEETELWDYQAALDQKIYPRPESGEGGEGPELTPENVKSNCWSSGSDQVDTNDLERYCRSVWPNLNRPHLEGILREGLRKGVWCAWEKRPLETFYTHEDAPAGIAVNDAWVLVEPASELARQLEPFRPGKGPQPVEYAGTPREALTHIREELGAFKNVKISEFVLTMNSRETLDNTLRATWADRPKNAAVQASLDAYGQREVEGKTETVQLNFEGRFDELNQFLSPIWPFDRQGNLTVTIKVRLTFDPPIPLTDGELETYKNAIMEANQGAIEARLVPARRRSGGNG
jgi:hypothetical protein